MSLREITKHLHHEAETTKFAKLLLSGKIEKKDYRNYLYNLMAVYHVIEFYSNRMKFFDQMPSLPRFEAICQDFKELDDGSYHYLTASTIEYVNYLHKLANDSQNKHLIKAHLYCRHMGDLNGGQIIKKQVPFSSGKFYDFENANELKLQIRKELDDSLGEEACVAFQWAIKMMKDLYNGE